MDTQKRLNAPLYFLSTATREATAARLGLWEQMQRERQEFAEFAFVRSVSEAEARDGVLFAPEVLHEVLHVVEH